MNGVEPQARAYHGAAVVKDSMVLFGGRNGLRRMDDTFTLELKESLGPAGSASARIIVKKMWKLEDFEMGDTLGTDLPADCCYCTSRSMLA